MSKFLKAVVPSVLALAYILIHLAVTGDLDKAALEAAVAGVVTSVAVYFVPNAAADLCRVPRVGRGVRVLRRPPAEA